MNVQIQAIHFRADQKLKDYIAKRLDKLSTFNDRIVNAEVFLKLEKRSSSIKDKVAEIKVHIPGSTLHAAVTAKAFEESVNLATESLRRQLKKHKEKRRN